MSSIARPLGIVAALMTALYVLIVRTGCACSPKYKAYISAAKSDLRNLVTVEEQRFDRDSTYTIVLDSLDDAFVAAYNYGPLRGQRRSLKYTASPGVHIQVTWADQNGWKAVARHDLLDGECVIFIGTVPEPPRIGGVVPNEGEPRCDMRKK